MGFYDFSVWKKLVGGDVTYPTATAWTWAGQNGTISPIPLVGPYTKFTGTADQTTKETVVDVSGRGELVFLGAEKNATTNSVSVDVTITVDGNAIFDGTAVNATTSASLSLGVAGSFGVEGAETGTDEAGGIPSIPFNKSLKIEADWSGTTGNAQSVEMYYWYWLT